MVRLRRLYPLHRNYSPTIAIQSMFAKDRVGLQIGNHFLTGPPNLWAITHNVPRRALLKISTKKGRVSVVVNQNAVSLFP